MNLTQLTTLVALSAYAIAGRPMAASANGISIPESVAEIQALDAVAQLKNVATPSLAAMPVSGIAQPETLSQMPEAQTPEAQTPSTGTPAQQPIEAPTQSEVQTPSTGTPAQRTNEAPTQPAAPTMQPAAPTMNEAPTQPAPTMNDAPATGRDRTIDRDVTRPADPRAGSKIQLGTQGIPPMTELPARISLPSESLLPVHFKNPIGMKQAMDGAIATASPITDKMVDPVWSRRTEDLSAHRTAYSESLVAWAARVTQCMNEKPKMYVLQANDNDRQASIELPMYFDGREGTIVKNKDGVSVCGM